MRSRARRSTSRRSACSTTTRTAPILEEDYGIPRRYLHAASCRRGRSSACDEFGGDIKQVPRRQALSRRSCARSAISKTEPGDENNQDISSLVGKVDIRKLESYSQDDPDAYSYSGGLCLANQGLLEFVEMFKAPIKVLHPLLTATQEGNYKGTEGFGAIPFDGIILAHSNESEWKTFRNNQQQRGFPRPDLHRQGAVLPARVGRDQDLRQAAAQFARCPNAPCAPGTLEMMAQFAVLSRLKEPENSSIFSKMRVYDGENLKDTDPKAKSLPGIPRLRRRRRRHERPLDPLRVQDPVQGVQLRQDRGRRQPGAPDVRARTADRARAVPARDRAALPRLHQGAPGAALRRVHRQGNPDGVSRVAIPSTARTSSTAT